MNKSRGILIVEDEILIAMCLEMEIKQAGYVVFQRVATGEQAVRIAKTNSWILF